MYDPQAQAAQETPAPPSADPKQTRVTKQLKHNSPFISCRFDPQGRYVFAGAEDSSVVRFSLADDKLTQLKGHESWVRAIGFSPDGAATYTGGYDGKLIWWETAAEAPAPVRSIQAHDGWLRALAVSPDGNLIVTVGNDNLVKVWQAADGALVRELKGHECHVYHVAFPPSGEEFVTVDLKGNVKQWKTADGALGRDMKVPDLHKYDPTFLADIGGARSIAFDKDGKLLALGGITEVSNAFAGIGFPAVVLLDWAKGEKVQLHKPKAKENGVTWGIEFHADGFLIAVAGGGLGGKLYFYKPDQPNEFHEVKLPGTGRDLHLHRPTQQLAVAHHDSHVRIYDMRPAEKK
jgi:WD40 repeat protein